MAARPAPGADDAPRASKFRTNVHVGRNITGDELRSEFDAILLAGGAEQPRDLPVPGRELKGIHFAMEFLPQQNKRCAGDEVPDQILATGKRVVIIGGGDTGADCLGTSHRQKAASVHQFEIMPKPPDDRAPQTPVAVVAAAIARRKLARRGRHARVEHGHRAFTGDEQRQREEAARRARGPAAEVRADPRHRIHHGCRSGAAGHGIHRAGAAAACSSSSAWRWMRAATSRPTPITRPSVPGVFAAGDMRRGQSLVVWAIAEGRKAAEGIDRYLVNAESLVAGHA